MRCGPSEVFIGQDPNRATLLTYLLREDHHREHCRRLIHRQYSRVYHFTTRHQRPRNQHHLPVKRRQRYHYQWIACQMGNTVTGSSWLSTSAYGGSMLTFPPWNTSVTNTSSSLTSMGSSVTGSVYLSTPANGGSRPQKVSSPLINGLAIVFGIFSKRTAVSEAFLDTCRQSENEFLVIVEQAH